MGKEHHTVTLPRTELEQLERLAQQNDHPVTKFEIKINLEEDRISKQGLLPIGYKGVSSSTLHIEIKGEEQFDIVYINGKQFFSENEMIRMAQQQMIGTMMKF